MYNTIIDYKGDFDEIQNTSVPPLKVHVIKNIKLQKFIKTFTFSHLADAFVQRDCKRTPHQIWTKEAQAFLASTVLISSQAFVYHIS